MTEIHMRFLCLRLFLCSSPSIYDLELSSYLIVVCLMGLGKCVSSMTRAGEKVVMWIWDEEKWGLVSLERQKLILSY